MALAAPVSVHSDLVAKFKAATEGSGQKGQLFKVQLNDEEIIQTDSANGTGNLETDFKNIAAMADEDKGAYFLMRVGDPREWLFLMYVPDTVGVKAKMVSASAKGTLKEKLGFSFFVEESHATSLEDLSWESIKGRQERGEARSSEELAHAQVLKEEEAARADMAQLQLKKEAEGAQSSQGGVGVNLPLDSEAKTAVESLKNSSGAVVLSLNSSRSQVSGKSLPNSPSEWPSHVHSQEPRFYLCRENEKVVFVYCCPSNAPPRMRMAYSSAKASVRAQVESMGLPMAPRSVEISEAGDLLENLRTTSSQPRVRPLSGKGPALTGRLGMDSSNAPDLGGQVKAKNLPTMGGEHPIYSLMGRSDGSPKKKIVIPPRAAYYG